jgi:hypothetical protein
MLGHRKTDGYHTKWSVGDFKKNVQRFVLCKKLSSAVEESTIFATLDLHQKHDEISRLCAFAHKPLFTVRSFRSTAIVAFSVHNYSYFCVVSTISSYS